MRAALVQPLPAAGRRVPDAYANAGHIRVGARAAYPGADRVGLFCRADDRG